MLRIGVICASFASIIWMGHAVNILFLGDSVMRGIVTDWCEKQHNKNASVDIQDWGSVELKYGMSNLKLHSPGYCNANGDSLAQMHLFGSNPVEPYYVDDWEKASSPQENRNTDFRIQLGLNTYLKDYGVPDKVIFATCNWDAAAMQRLRVYQQSFTPTTFVNNSLRIISLIKETLGDHVDKVDIGVQTCVLDWTIHAFIEDYNNAYRNMSLQYGLTLYDYDFDVWSTADFVMDLENQYYIFHKKHDIHPSEPYPTVAADKLLGHLYSKYYYHKGERHQHPFGHIPATLKSVRFIQSVGSNEVYLAHLDSEGKLSRYKGVTKTLLRAMHMSSADIMEVTAELFATIPLVGQLPSLGDTNSIAGYIAVDGRCVLYLRGKFYLLQDYLMMKLLLAENKITRGLPNILFDSLSLDVETFKQHPSIFINGLLVRGFTDKQVYLVDNYRKQRIMSAAAFFRRGWDFDNVTVINDMMALMYYPLLPDGEDVN